MSNPEDRSDRATRENLEQALTTIDRLVKTNNIGSDARATATTLYQRTLEEYSALHGWKIKTAACACLFLACKVEKEGISPDAIASHHENVDKKILLRRAKTLQKELGLDYVDLVDPVQYVQQYTDELGADDDMAKRAVEILEEIEDTHLISGRNPRALAAAAIYNAAIDYNKNHTEITQSRISDVANISSVTIRNRYKEQREFLTEE